LEIDLHPGSLPVAAALDAHAPAQETFGCAPLYVADLAPIEHLAWLHGEDGHDRIGMGALRLADRVTDPNRLAGCAVNGPLLHLAARARSLARRRNRSELDTDLARGALHPLPARYLVDDHLKAAHVDAGERIGSQLADRDARHLCLGVCASHHIRVEDGALEMGSGH